jgi:NAD(P)-dependent dehydrogenase (short-subunit alcohol dehydrogenase family)
MSESLKGKVAVISGVGSRFAKATAELFARQDQVSRAIHDINEAGLKATANSCEAAGARVVSFVADATKPETSQRALAECLKASGEVDFLVNYAGGAVKVAPIEEMDDEVNRKILDLNPMSTIMSCRTFTTQLKTQGYGKTINVSNACDMRSWPGWRARATCPWGTRCRGTTWSWTALSPCFWGGAAFSGGSGSVAKTIVGALIIMCVTTGLMTIIPAFCQAMAKGSVLITAEVLNHLLVREKAK